MPPMKYDPYAAHAHAGQDWIGYGSSPADVATKPTAGTPMADHAPLAPACITCEGSGDCPACQGWGCVFCYSTGKCQACNRPESEMSEAEVDLLRHRGQYKRAGKQATNRETAR